VRHSLVSPFCRCKLKPGSKRNSHEKHQRQRSGECTHHRYLTDKPRSWPNAGDWHAVARATARAYPKEDGPMLKQWSAAMVPPLVWKANARRGLLLIRRRQGHLFTRGFTRRPGIRHTRFRPRHANGSQVFGQTARMARAFRNDRGDGPRWNAQPWKDPRTPYAIGGTTAPPIFRVRSGTGKVVWTMKHPAKSLRPEPQWELAIRRW